MAFIAGTKWFVVFGIYDNNDNAATLSFNYDGALAFTALVTEVEGLRDAIIALTDARVKGYSITRDYRNDDTSAIASTSEVERKLMITFGDATGEYISSLQVPSPIFAVEQVGTDVVNPAQTQVAAFIDAVTNGGLGGGNSPVAWSGADLVGIKGSPKVKHVSRKSKG